jgi:hypothetical protein
MIRSLALVLAVVLASERPVDAEVRCQVGQRTCGGKCVAPTPQNGCGQNNCTACSVVGAAPACEGPDLTCGYTQCFHKRIDLDGKRHNGCEAYEVGLMRFLVPNNYTRGWTPTETRYEMQITNGNMVREEKVSLTGSVYLTVQGKDTTDAIDHCMALAPTVPKVWIEIYKAGAAGQKIVQVPYVDNSPQSPPNYSGIVLRVPAEPMVVRCLVNREPPNL